MSRSCALHSDQVAGTIRSHKPAGITVGSKGGTINRLDQISGATLRDERHLHRFKIIIYNVRKDFGHYHVGDREDCGHKWPIAGTAGA